MDEGEASDVGGRLRQLVQAHGRVVESYLSSIERDHMVRDEIWSDVFGIALHHLDELEELDPAQVRSWLLRTSRYVTANTTRRTFTRRRLLERLTREPLEVALSAEDEFLEAEPSDESEEQRPQLRAAWDQLSSREQDILAMDALGDRGPVLADRLGITHQAARLRLMRARSAFGNAYRRVCNGDDDRTGRP